MTGQPNLEPDRGPRCRGPIPDQRRGCAGRNPDRGGRQCRQPGPAGRAALRPGGAISSRLFAIPGKRSKTSACFRPPASASRWRSFARSAWRTALRQLYREANSRYVAIKYSVRGRDLGGTVEEAMRKVDRAGEAAAAVTYMEWAGEYESQKRAEATVADHRAAHRLSDLPDHLCALLDPPSGPASTWSMWPWRGSAVCWRCTSRARISACRRALGFWLCSAPRFRPA